MNQDLNNICVVAVDSSLKRPGFAIIKVNNGTIQSIKLSNVNNKTDTKKCHGELLDDIRFHWENRICPLFHDEEYHVVFARQHTAPNHFNETACFEVVGLLNWEVFREFGNKKKWFQYYPVTVKKTMTNDGKATKVQVAESLTGYVGQLNYDCDDESDALAVGLTYLIKNNIIHRKGDDINE